MFLARKWTWIAQSKVKCTNQEILLVALCYKNWDKLWPKGAFICLPAYLPTYKVHTHRGWINSAHPCNQATVRVSTCFNYLHISSASLLHYCPITVPLQSPLLLHSNFYPWVLFHHRSTQLGNTNLTIQQTFWIVLFWYVCFFNFHFLH